MPRHPLPPFQKRRAVVSWAFLAVMVLGTALLKTAQARRELVHQKLAWRIPEWGIRSGTLTLSGDGKYLTYCFASKHVNFNDTVRIFDTHTGDVLADAPRPSSSWPPPALDNAEIKSRDRNGMIAWLPYSNGSAPLSIHLERRGKSTLLLPPPSHFSQTNPVSALHLSSDGNLLTILDQRALWQMDVKTQRVIHLVLPRKIAHRSFSATWANDIGESDLSPDEKFIIALAPRPTLYDAHTGVKIRSFGTELEMQCGGCGCIEPTVGFSPDKKLMWVFEDKAGGGNLAFWRINDGKEIWHHYFADWSFDPTGRYVMSLSSGTVHDATTGKIVCRLKSSNFDDPFTFSRDGRQLYTLGVDGLIRHYRLP